MGRKALSDEELEKTYSHIVNYLILHDIASAEEIIETLKINKGRLSKSLQFGRRNFPKKTPAENLVLGSPKGYFIPGNKDEVIAWYFQYKGFASSILKTIDGVGSYLRVKYPQEMEAAQLLLMDSEESENDPWGIFNTLVQKGEK